MSTSACVGRESQAEKKGKPPKYPLSSRGADAGTQDKIMRTVTFRGVLSFWAVSFFAVCRECWIFSRIRGFLFAKNERM